MAGGKTAALLTVAVAVAVPELPESDLPLLLPLPLSFRAMRGGDASIARTSCRGSGFPSDAQCKAELPRARSSLSTLSRSIASLDSAARSASITVFVVPVTFSTWAFVAASAASRRTTVVCSTSVEEEEDAEDSDPCTGGNCG